MDVADVLNDCLIDFYKQRSLYHIEFDISYITMESNISSTLLNPEM